MGKQPAVVIIVRHGSRLDQANKQWHLSSPTPYDPPLTYGGWAQTQSLGLRIASILASNPNETQQKPPGSAQEGQPVLKLKPRGQRIILHSSPFLRCIQTSIGISAGIGQYAEDESGSHITRSPSLSKQALPPGILDNIFSVHAPNVDSFLPVKLRVDAFLGEWLCPEYFENIAPPPSSALMNVNAKARLRMPTEEIRGADLSPLHSARLTTNSSIDTSEALGQAIPSRARAAGARSEKESHLHTRFHGSFREEELHYAPPIPTYAISPSEPIPLGFVAHARDACVDIDYQWDSMRLPLEWGTGGDLGEEWGTMHRRLRNGLQKMLKFYESEDDTELILVLITHGACCNALIGAMTSAPVLLDVGVASLTLARRKDPSELIYRSPTQRRRSVDLGIADDYDMKIIASSEHLRSNPNPLGLNSPGLGRSPAFASRNMVGPDSSDGFSIGATLAWRPSSSAGRSRSSSQRIDSTVLHVPTGLWKSQSSKDDMTDSSESESLPNFDHTPKGRGDHLSANVVARNEQMPPRLASQPGLWGSSEGNSEAPESNERGTKRRWTASMGNP